MGRGLENGLIQRVLDALGLEKHTAQATTEEHDRNGHMLHVSGTPWFTPTREMFQKDVGDSIGENHTGFGELAVGDFGLQPGHNRARRLYVPGPTQIGPAAQPSSEGQNAVPEEDTTFDKVSESVENLDTSLRNC